MSPDAGDAGTTIVVNRVSWRLLANGRWERQAVARPAGSEGQRRATGGRRKPIVALNGEWAAECPSYDAGIEAANAKHLESDMWAIDTGNPNTWSAGLDCLARTNACSKSARCRRVIRWRRLNREPELPSGRRSYFLAPSRPLEASHRGLPSPSGPTSAWPSLSPWELSRRLASSTTRGVS